MSNDARGERLRNLSSRNLELLFIQKLPRLGDQSCRDLLGEFVKDLWEQLALESCALRQHPEPVEADAVKALDAIKFKFSSGSVTLPDLTPAELLKILKHLTLGSWATVLGILSTIVIAAFWFGAVIGEHF